MTTLKVLTSREEQVTVEAEEGKTLLLAAVSQGEEIPFVCMNAECHTCKVLVLAGADALMPPEPEEQESLGEAELSKGYRLSCQAVCRAE